MLSKQYRLPKYLISTTIQQGKRFSCRYGTLCVVNHSNSSRWAIIVKKHRRMTAVERNYIKRIIRNTILVFIRSKKCTGNYIVLCNKTDGAMTTDSLIVSLRNSLGSIC